MSPSAWIAISNASIVASIVLGVVLALAAFITVARPHSTPLSRASATFFCSWLASIAIWQNWPTFILSDAARNMAVPSYSPQASMIVKNIFPNYQPWWAGYPSSLLIVAVSANLLICLYLVVWMHARARSRLHDEEPEPDHAAS